NDTEDPNTISLPLINAECGTTVSTPTITDNCGGTITGTTSDPVTFSTQGSYAITWNFDDGNGNNINIIQNIIIDDVTDPVANCQDLTVQLDNISGTASITPNQINNGSTDNCGIANLSLSKSMFDCTNIGSNIIILTVTDVGGNTDTCTANVTVVSPTISGGTVTGYLNNTETPADADDLVEVTACPDEPQNATFTVNGYTGNIVRWESSIDGGVNWTSIINTTNTYYYPNILETTLLRAVIQIGSCQATSTITIVSVIPPDIPPTIVGSSSFSVCLGDDVTVEAQSEFGINPNFNNGGMFNEANLNNLGWEVDGAAEMSAGGNNTNNTYWKLTNGPKKFNGRCYDSPDGNKFAIVSGIPQYDAPDHTITPLSTLETSIFNTLGLVNASLEFDQAYYLEAGAWCLIELSLDGGTTYSVTLDPGATYNYTGPSDTGFGDVGFNGQCRNSPGTYIDNHVSIELQNYVGLTNLRIRFTYSGTANSTWALENITIPQAPVDEVIEWTDETGTVVTTGSTTTITPVTPGVQTYGVTSLINGCRSDGDEGTEFIDVSVSFAYAGKDISPILGECGKSTVSLNAYDNTLTAAQNIANGAYNNNYTTGDYPGTGDAGVWSVVSMPNSCGGNYSFSSALSPANPLGDPSAYFTGDPGTYTLRWSIADCSFDDVEVTIDNCNTVDFDGSDDYATFGDNFDRSSDFSFEVWVKPELFSGIQSIISKRDANNLNTGYDLRLSNDVLSFNWNNSGVVSCPYNLTTNRWYHVAVTFSSNAYRLYIDGILVNTTGGAIPSPNTNKFLFGAMDTNTLPTHYFNGWIDEIRIWNTALNVDQIREMMNQQIQSNGNLVRGEIVPLDISGLNWTNLDGYYRMDLNCGRLTTNAGSVNGRLRNMYTSQQQTAPLPYTTNSDGNWYEETPWTYAGVWDAPNSMGLDNETIIDWNIVKTSHNIISKGDTKTINTSIYPDRELNDIVVLGLVSDTAGKELTIINSLETENENNSGKQLLITHYLELDGTIDLVGESQLVQSEGSILDQDSGGTIERDQQGTGNSFNYNYWTSSVNPQTPSGIGQLGIGIPSTNANYSIANVIRDGTNSTIPAAINFQAPYTAADGVITSPITLSSYWLFKFNGTANDYNSWISIDQNTSLQAGEGHTMKGTSGLLSITTPQNYVFKGKPNNGNISLSISTDNNRLIGNPYPSAIDANEFILDNINEYSGRATTNIINGALYFWDHFGGGSHILQEYVGGYATYTLLGGVKAISNDIRINDNGSEGTKVPGRYIPVNQGFFVSTSLDPSLTNTTTTVTGGNIVFKNSQRTYKREGIDNSVMFRTTEISEIDERQKIRLMFDSPSGYHRQLLVGVDELTSPDFDLGFDAPLIDINTEDMFWDFDDVKYVIQAVNNFDEDQILPIGLVINEEGLIVIRIDQLENISDNTPIYIYDSLLNTYHNLRESNFEIQLIADQYLNRFFITFHNDTLSINSLEKDKLVISYLSNSQYIFIKTLHGHPVDKIELYNIIGQKVRTWLDKESNSSDSISVPVIGVAQGTYIVKVYSNDLIYNKKIIIDN
ncbi:LamG-like jellyroll fold domain-containing protein, partial [Ichthyenterobacterium sp. W332]